MPTDRRLRFVHWQLGWMLAVVVALAVLGSLSLEVFFICSLIGLLVITELTAPFAVEPAWRARLPWLILVGLLGFAAIVVRHVVSILPPEVLPL